MKVAASLVVLLLLKLLSMANLRAIGEDGEMDNSEGSDHGKEKMEKPEIKRGCSGEIEEYKDKDQDVENLSFDELYSLLRYNRSDFVLLDVRTPLEHAEGHIPASFLVTITDGVFEDHIDFRQILCGRKFIVIYCRSGRRAAVAAEITKKLVPILVAHASNVTTIRREALGKDKQFAARHFTTPRYLGPLGVPTRSYIPGLGLNGTD